MNTLVACGILGLIVSIPLTVAVYHWYDLRCLRIRQDGELRRLAEQHKHAIEMYTVLR